MACSSGVAPAREVLGPWQTDVRYAENHDSYEQVAAAVYNTDAEVALTVWQESEPPAGGAKVSKDHLEWVREQIAASVLSDAVSAFTSWQEAAEQMEWPVSWPMAVTRFFVVASASKLCLVFNFKPGTAQRLLRWRCTTR